MKHRPLRNSLITALSMSAVGVTIALSSFAVVHAERVMPDANKAFKCSKGTACVEALSSGASTEALLATAAGGRAAVEADNTATSGYGNYGVIGSSKLAAGLFGQSSAPGGAVNNSGVYGYSSQSSPGLFGESANGPGVAGTGTASDGVDGNSSTGNGVYGSSTQGFGAEGYSADASGVYGYGGIGVGVSGEAGGYGEAIYGQADDYYTNLFYLLNESTYGICEIDNTADLYCSGTLMGAREGLRDRHRNSAGKHVVAYAAESASATMEDVGHGRLFDGVTNVAIPSDFASVVDRSDYYVFLTPLGDASLYVSAKTASGFQVRETNRGRASLEFDYRIVARPLDATADRLPAAPRIWRPHVALRRPQPLRFSSLSKPAHR